MKNERSFSDYYSDFVPDKEYDIHRITKSIEFDYLTIFPPSKKFYKTFWVTNNCTILAFKFMFEELMCVNKEFFPRIKYEPFSTIVSNYIDKNELPKELLHVAKVSESGKINSGFSRIGNKILSSLGIKGSKVNSVLSRIGDPIHFFKSQEDITKIKLDFENARKHLKESAQSSNINSALNLKVSDENWNHSEYAINFTCCDYKLVRRFRESDFRESIHPFWDSKPINLFLIRSGDDFGWMHYFSSKPDQNILHQLALEKLTKFSPNEIRNFLDFHCMNCKEPIYEFMNYADVCAEQLYSKPDTPKNIEYRIAFKNWLNDTIKSKSKELDYQKFSDSVKKKIKISQSTPEPKPTTTPELIKLNYGANNDKIIQLLHVELNGAFIENIDFNEFERHFKDNGVELKKMQWKGTQPEIIRLFTGLLPKHSKNIDGSDLYGIELDSDYEGYHQIIEHFYYLSRSKREKTDFIYETLTSKKSSETKRENTTRIHTILDSIRNVVS